MNLSHYLDIKLLPDPEFSAILLLEALYAKFHRALVTQHSDQIGVSFPQYRLKPRTLGNTVRLHGSEQDLLALDATNWLTGMRDHIHLSPISPVPESTKFQVFKRRQFKTNADRLRRRRMARKGETYEQAVSAIPSSVEREPDLPYLNLRSHSTGQRFCLFVELGNRTDRPTEGIFNCYGLSQNATVPWF
ncbi:type I-F CRISPR-associated endoribonuclease Cas6/Csy4 [Pseudolysobacter antarcticus]|uniref:Type I-F CRISPR-associated endoribonuclease Cas6/Csy4 n=1 Tax=Pseudolysobacter antarcticus TaxID=2511995 RepID=A0A411HG72_9GAMM|nr:type I-F CRISPR-associated endoribonuclease Cas6/Csy4 [Pseudolysobacter antarcticus]QBB69464.1 type I-F CRISPR-associated endoribonuclease Cas6/Csy4 [Pseudolysobacter antarcticus]